MLTFLLNALVLVMIYMILSTSCDLILGYAGLWQIGHGAFYCLGAYTGALIALHLHWPFVFELLASALVAASIGAILSASMVRVSPDYLSLGTFGFSIVVYSAMMNWHSLTRGALGLPNIPHIEIFGRQIITTAGHFVLLLIVAICTLLTLYLLVKSPFGRILKALRDDEIALLAAGRDIVKLRILAYGIGVLFAGIAGNLYAHYVTFIDPTAFGIQESILVLCIVVLGGMGTIKGPVVGTFLIVFLPEMLRFLGLPSTTGGLIRQVLYGLVLVLVLVYRPGGLLGVRVRTHSR